MGKATKRKRRRGGKKRRRPMAKLGRLRQVRPSDAYPLYGFGRPRRVAKGQPIIGGLNWLRSQDGLYAAGSVIAGGALGLAVTRAFQSWVMTPKAEDYDGSQLKAINQDPMTNILGDLLAAGVAWELGHRFAKDPSVAMFAAASAATRFISQHYVNPMVQEKFVDTLKYDKVEYKALKGLGAWYEYDYEGGGVGQVRLPEAGLLGIGMGQERFPDDEGLYGLDAYGEEESTLFG